MNHEGYRHDEAHDSIVCGRLVTEVVLLQNFTLMGAVKFGLKSRTNPADMCCLSARLSKEVKYFVAVSIDVYRVM